MVSVVKKGFQNGFIWKGGGGRLRKSSKVNFQKKIILNNKNIKGFLTKKNKKQSTNTDLFIGFF